MKHSLTLPNIAVPVSLIKELDHFGGRLIGECLVGDLVIQGTRAVGLRASDRAQATRLLTPKFAESHVHLDKCFTFDRIGNLGGDLVAAIEAQAKDRAGWTRDDLTLRAGRALDDLCRFGCHVVRSHVDWTHGSEADQPPLAWHVLNELAQARKEDLTLQIAALTGIEDLADPAMANAIGRLCAAKNGVLGAFVFGQPKLAEGIRQAFLVADRYGLMLDFHVDEGMDPALNGLEVIADTALATGFEGPILCGHACSLATKPASDVARITDKLARAGITIATLPTTNLYLQGRAEQGMGARGMTAVKELCEAGVDVITGTDNVQDAFYPMGSFDPRRALELALVTAHLDPPLGAHLPMIGHMADRALGVTPRYVDTADISDLLLFDAASPAAMLSAATPPVPLSQAMQGVFQ